MLNLILVWPFNHSALSQAASWSKCDVLGMCFHMEDACAVAYTGIVRIMPVCSVGHVSEALANQPSVPSSKANVAVRAV